MALLKQISASRFWAIWTTRNLAIPTLLAVLVFAVSTLTSSAFGFRAQLNKTRAASSDSRVWSIAQAEVDHKNLLLLLQNLRAQQAGESKTRTTAADTTRLLNKLPLAFDIFYSRIGIVQALLSKGDLPEHLLANLNNLIAARAKLADTFDAMDPTDPAQLVEFEGSVSSLTDPTREVVLNGLEIFITEENASRTYESLLWQRFLITSFALLIAMKIAMGITYLLHRQLNTKFEHIKLRTDSIRLVFETSMLGVVITKRNMEIQLVNAAAERIFEHTEADMIGCRLADTIFPHHRREKYLDDVRCHQATGFSDIINSGASRMTAIRSDGSEFPIEISISTEVGMNGEEVCIAFIRDISEQMAYEKNLREARDQAAEHAAAKTMFLAAMSHEMRTPLHGLIASLDLIDDQSCNAETKGFIKTARNCGLRTLHQINDVLDLTQLDEAKEGATVFAPVKTVQTIMEELRPLARDRGNRISLHINGAATDTTGLGTPKTFSRVMYNLIGNALKFTQAGSVIIRLSFTAQFDGAPMLSVSVEDTGKGISPEDQKYLFELFFTGVSNQPDFCNSDTGLGLPIVQTGVQKMGGSVSVESQLGVGSTFSFEIPLAVEHDALPLSQSSPNTTAQSALGLQCLVVDDNRVNLDLTAQMLQRLGCDVVRHTTGEAAVTSAKEQKFDVILMDLNMPGGLSGIETTRQIRAHETRSGAQTKAAIIALTADTTFGAPAILSTNAMDGVLHKPVLRQDLRQALTRLQSHKSLPASQNNFLSNDTSDLPISEFAELFDLVGQAHGERLLIGVLNDIDAVLTAMENQATDAVDHLHRAVGSTAAVGLLSFSQKLRHAEDLARTGAKTALCELLIPLQTAATDAQTHIRASL